MVSLLFEPKNSGILFCSTLRLKLAGPVPPLGDSCSPGGVVVIIIDKVIVNIVVLTFDLDILVSSKLSLSRFDSFKKRLISYFSPLLWFFLSIVFLLASFLLHEVILFCQFR